MCKKNITALEKNVIIILSTESRIINDTLIPTFTLVNIIIIIYCLTVRTTGDNKGIWLEIWWPQ